MKLLFHLIGFLICAALPLLAQADPVGGGPDDNGMGRGGGDEYGLIFRAEGNRIADLLDAWSQATPEPFGIDPRQFRETVRTTGFKRLPHVFVLIEPCRYHPEVRALPECQGAGASALHKRHRVEVSAANIPAERMIEISDSRWPALVADPDRFSAVVAHEYLQGADRYYEKSAQLFARLRVERDAVVFRRELKARMSAAVDAVMDLLTPSFDELKVTFATMETTSDYLGCLNAVAGSREAVVHCPPLAAALKRAGNFDFTRSDQHERLMRRERAAEAALNTWIDALAIRERREFALDLEGRLYEDAKLRDYELKLFMYQISLEVDPPYCPQSDIACAIRKVHDLMENRLPEQMKSLRAKLQKTVDGIQAEIDQYADGYSPASRSTTP